MLPVPTTPFELVTWGTAKVGRDCHAQVQSSLYSIPSRYVGQRAGRVAGGQDRALLGRHAVDELLEMLPLFLRHSERMTGAAAHPCYRGRPVAACRQARTHSSLL